MPIGPFDTIEVITLIFNMIAFLFIFKAYLIGIDTPATKKFWGLFLLIAFFVLLNRIFTNLEALALKEAFNLMEHFSTLIAAVILAFVAKNALKGESNA